MKLKPTAIAILAALTLPFASAHADPVPDTANWDAVTTAARGQTVDWYAWGGETHINDYIAWVGSEVATRYGITLRQVKLTDTAEAVSRVLAETVAGQDDGGAVDLIWINGENFVAMKEKGLLLGGEWAEALPNRPLVDLGRYGAAILTDFGVPVEGQQSPWGRAQLVFIYDTARTDPPRTLEGLLAFAAENPGRFTYPQPPNFVGTSFLKQILLDTVPDPAVLRAPAGDGAEALVRDNLLPVLERLHPDLWRSAAVFPQSVADLRRLFADGEIALALTYNPSDAAAAVADGLLPPTAAIGAFEGGTLGNVHFVGIPHNAGDKAGALVIANFLLSPAAQARKADIAVWGDPSVLDIAALPAAEQAAFASAPTVDAPTLAEPHASWTAIIERVWDEAFL
ncbi:ABC transporter substrate-binding protein [Acuticoccus sp. MNP-M23]|uniref:ABC transporter substrate-binding protein n=1 Tax=Acuticoccus sp. MNP-M23 TaxID=3072793 RepID=UPI0028162F02|nr:ABC transporter substrate-binding protein [Acuticoccus sp. MNP-M23]WMS42818.1 ABC transporter substrate-binding protein [Acuticoccus sp. MNP-M23]